MPNVKRFLEDNKVYFETIAALSVSVAGVVVSGAGVALFILQLVLSESSGKMQEQLTKQGNDLKAQQNAIALQQREIYEKEIELVRLQTDIAVSKVTPKFAISMSNLAVPCVQVSHSGAEITHVQGSCIAYLSIRDSAGNVKRIELKNYYGNRMSGPDRSGKLYSFFSKELYRPAAFNYCIENYPPSRDEIMKWVELPTEFRIFIEIDYVDVAGRNRLKRFDAHFPLYPQDIEPVQERPEFLESFDVAQFYSDDKQKYDISAMLVALQPMVRRHLPSKVLESIAGNQ